MIFCKSFIRGESQIVDAPLVNDASFWTGSSSNVVDKIQKTLPAVRLSRLLPLSTCVRNPHDMIVWFSVCVTKTLTGTAYQIHLDSTCCAKCSRASPFTVLVHCNAIADKFKLSDFHTKSWPAGTNQNQHRLKQSSLIPELGKTASSCVDLIFAGRP